MGIFFNKKNNEISYASCSCLGSRDVNEDAVGVYENGEEKCFILCDGLGGHGMGDVASQLVVDVVKSRFFDSNEFFNDVGANLKAAQDILMTEQSARKANRKMKTTAVLCATDGRKAYICHIGDSRVYLFKDNKIVKRTLDHSIPQMLAISGEIKEEEIRNHSERNVLLRVLGVDWEQNMYEQMKPIPLGRIQAILLCSDGFWELITENEMESSLSQANSVQDWLNSMIKKVEVAGEGRIMDNFSAIAVWNQ